MKSKVLILYSSIDGHTRKIIQYIISKINISNHEIEVICIDEKTCIDILKYKTILIASSIRYGKHHPKILQFIKQNYQLLNSIPSSFISVNLVARKPEKSDPTTNPYVSKFLKSISWKPNLVAVFAGVLNYRAYTFWDRLMIQIIMKMTNGPTKSDTHIEYTNWTKVDQYINDFEKLIMQDFH